MFTPLNDKDPWTSLNTRPFLGEIPQPPLNAEKSWLDKMADSRKRRKEKKRKKNRYNSKINNAGINHTSEINRAGDATRQQDGGIMIIS